jgi:hypothetical protein
MSSLGIGEPDLTTKVIQRLKDRLAPFQYAYNWPSTRGRLKAVLMEFFTELQRHPELPFDHPYMRVVNVEVKKDPHDPERILLRFVDERGATINLPI